MTKDARYSALDRFLHHLAFRGLGLQQNLGEIEDATHAKHLDSIAIDRPIFITSLPRAGTTLLLDFVRGMGPVATHTYRDMPFVLCPLTWRAMSRNFRQPSVLQERRHGDGVSVGFDSAEAFEEIIWRAFWSGHYEAKAIRTWSAQDRSEEFEIFFRNHIKKHVLLQAQSASPLPRYASKNNANIARLDLLAQLFPDAVLLVIFRNPVDHATSLFRQHRNFTAIHAREPFTLRYMMDIGHYEFGAALKPIAFDDFGEDVAKADAVGFWLEYWMAAFSHILACKSRNVVLLSYDRLCEDPVRTLAALSQALEFSTPVDDLAARCRASGRYDHSVFQADRLERAHAIHRELLSRAIV